MLLFFFCFLLHFKTSPHPPQWFRRMLRMLKYAEDAPEETAALCYLELGKKLKLQSETVTPLPWSPPCHTAVFLH